MPTPSDDSLVFLNAGLNPSDAATHVLIIGVGHYAFGKGSPAGAGGIAADLEQLSSPVISARTLADWFVAHFKNSAKPLGSVSLLVSEQRQSPYVPPVPMGVSNGAQPTGAANNGFAPPDATLAAVEVAADGWAERLRSNRDNMAVFFFCGHGISLGQKAALLLRDFGKPLRPYADAIDVDVLLGTMKNCPAVQQLFVFDCCRTRADDLYNNETNIGGRVATFLPYQRGHAIPAQQCVLFPSLDGEEAFGRRDDASVFTQSLIDALSFAAADPSTGTWRTNTGNILSALDRLVRLRVPPTQIGRAKPSSPNATAFDVNEIAPPTMARSFVTFSDPGPWGTVVVDCVDPVSGQIGGSENTANHPEKYCSFDLPEGRWRFTANPQPTSRTINQHDGHLRLPVAYVTLDVQP